MIFHVHDMTGHDSDDFQLFIIELVKRHQSGALLASELIVKRSYTEKFHPVGIKRLFLDGLVQELEILFVHDLMMVGRLFLVVALLDGLYFGTVSEDAFDVKAKVLLAQTHRIVVMNVFISLCF